MNEDGLITESLSVREILAFYYRNRRKLLIAFFVPLAFFIAVSFLPSPQYPATATLIVRMASEYLYQPEIGSGRENSPAGIPFDRDQVFKSEVAILSSDELHREVIEKIGADVLYPPATGPVADFKRSVKKTLRDALTQIGVPEKKSTPEELAQQKLDFDVEIFDKHFNTLLEKDSAVINVAYEHKDPELAKKVMTTLLDLYFDKRKDLYHEDRVARVQVQLDQARSRMDSATAAVEQFKKAHNVHSIDNQREILLDSRSDVEKMAANIKSDELDEKLAYYNGQLRRLDTLEQQMDLLDNDAKVASDQYALYARKLDEAKSFEAQEKDRASGVRVVQEPMTPAQPKSLQFLFIIAGVFVSILSMLGCAAILEFVNNGFDTPERLERRLGLPVLAVISLRGQAS